MANRSNHNATNTTYTSLPHTKRKLLVGPSKWVPPKCLQDVHINSCTQQLHKLVRDRVHTKQNQTPSIPNISTQEREMLSKLLDHPKIIIKPADKGSATVILNRSAYEAEAIRQLTNTKHYLELPAALYPENTKRITQFIHQLYRSKFITSKQRDWFQPDPDTVRARKFYLLPKIHKSRTLWYDSQHTPPGRPIVSDVDSENYKISSLVDYYLAPFATSHPSYIKDTWDFIDKLRKITVPQHAYLATMDVNSLYTNINNKDGMAAIRRAFNNNDSPPLKTIADLMEFILSSNDFEFNNHYFLQISGTAMGKIFAPHYADIYMADWERVALRKCKIKPYLYLRYLDDIFTIWTHSKEEFIEFYNTLNLHHSTIKLTYELHPTTINFLDVTIYKGNRFKTQHVLDTKVYFKPTDTHELLHRSSYHPRHTFSGIIKSQVLRYHRICNNTHDFETAINTLFPVLFERGYNKIQTYRILTQTLKRENETPCTQPCLGRTCTICPLLHPITFTIKTPHGTHTLKSDGDCGTTNCIYALVCRQCNIIYVGQTNNLRNRIHNHLSNIKNLADTPPAQHFHSHGGRANVLVRILQLFDSHLNLPEIHVIENNWIKRLQTLNPQGLNTYLSPAPTPIPFITPFTSLSNSLSQQTRIQFEQLNTHIPKFEYTAKALPASSKRRNIAQHVIRTQYRSNPIPQLNTVHPTLQSALQQQETQWKTLTPQQWIQTRTKYIRDYSPLTQMDTQSDS